MPQLPLELLLLVRRRDSSRHLLMMVLQSGDRDEREEMLTADSPGRGWRRPPTAAAVEEVMRDWGAGEEVVGRRIGG